MQMAPQEDWSFMQACLHVEDEEDWWDSIVVPSDTVNFVDDDQDFVRVESGIIGESFAEVVTASEAFVRVQEGTKGRFIIVSVLYELFSYTMLIGHVWRRRFARQLQCVVFHHGAVCQSGQYARHGFSLFYARVWCGGARYGGRCQHREDQAQAPDDYQPSARQVLARHHEETQRKTDQDR